MSRIPRYRCDPKSFVSFVVKCRSCMTAEVAEYLVHLEKERDVSPHTVKAYARDLEAFTEFCDRHYGDWNWATVDRLGFAASSGSCSAKAWLAAVRRERSRRCGVSIVFSRSIMASPTPSPGRHGCRNWRNGCRATWIDSRRGRSSSGPSRGRGRRVRPTRDLAILELFYSTGMRLSELCGMNLEDLDLLADQAKVRGKGRKERIVPVGSRAVLALRRYLQLRERSSRDRRAIAGQCSSAGAANGWRARGVQRIVHGMLDGIGVRRASGALAPPHLRYPHAGCRG